MIRKAKRLSTIAVFVSCLYLVSATLPALPAGTDWSQYIMGSEVIWNFDTSLHYPAWRKPLYSYLLGLFAGDSYLQSGRILASIGFCCTLFAFLLWFRKRSWVLGSCLMLGFSFHPLVLDGLNYLNPYPLLGGLVTLGTVLSIQKDSRFFRIFTGGLAVGAAIALDGRAWVLAPLICISFLRKKKATRLWIAWFLGLLPSFYWNAWLVSSFHLELLSLREQLWEQRTFLFREDMAFQLFPFHNNNGLVAGYCAGESQYITMEWFFSDCMRWLAATNWSAIQNAGILPSWEIIGGLFLLTIWRAKNHAFWGLVVSALGFSLLVWATPRYYFLSLGAVFILIGELALLLGRRGWSQTVCCAGIFWLWFLQANFSGSTDYPREWRGVMPKLISVVGDSRVLDCSRKDIWLVRSSSRRAGGYSLFLDEKDCISLLKKEAFQFVIFPAEAENFLSNTAWREKERFKVQRETFLLFQSIRE